MLRQKISFTFAHCFHNEVSNMKMGEKKLFSTNFRKSGHQSRRPKNRPKPNLGFPKKLPSV